MKGGLYGSPFFCIVVDATNFYPLCSWYRWFIPLAGKRVALASDPFSCYVLLMSWQTDFKLTIDDKLSSGWEASSSPTVSPWTVQEIPAYQSDENLKKQFGIELAKSANAFEAGCNIFGDETSKALWVSFNWVNDPLVIASRDIYLKTLEINLPVLDRQQLAAKALAIADEKILRNGVMLPTVEAKDRLAAIRLYSDIIGYTGKVEIDNSITKNVTNNEIKIKLVRAEEKKPVIIDNAPNVKSEIQNEKSPISLKLVKAS